MEKEKQNMYANGKIYKITCGDLTYYGSTVQALSNRMAKHRTDYKKWKNGKHHYMTSFKLFENENNTPIITLVEKFLCESKEELHARERFYIENNECVNKVIPTRTKKEYFADNADKFKEKAKEWTEANAAKIKEQKKTYYIDNADKFKEKAREWREANASKIKEQKQAYYQANADKFKEKAKKWREANSDKVKEQKKAYQKAYADKIKEQSKLKFNCTCGANICLRQKIRHERSNKHIKFVATQAA